MSTLNTDPRILFANGLAGPDRVATIKWIASILSILGYGATGFGFTPWNIYFFIAGVTGWLVVGLLWKDRAIILIHVVAIASLLLGMIAS